MFLFADTTDVQNPTAVAGLNGVLLECNFVTGSKAQGCYVELTLTSNTSQSEWVPVSREPGATTTQMEITTSLPAHCYSINVYDWEEDGSMGGLPIYVSSAGRIGSCEDSTPNLTMDPNAPSSTNSK